MQFHRQPAARLRASNEHPTARAGTAAQVDFEMQATSPLLYCLQSSRHTPCAVLNATTHEVCLLLQGPPVRLRIHRSPRDAHLSPRAAPVLSECEAAHSESPAVTAPHRQRDSSKYRTMHARYEPALQ